MVLGFLLEILFCIACLFVLGYGTMQLNLIIKVLTISPKTKTLIQPTIWPMVTIQLPIFNEQYVVQNLFESICLINYPKEKLQFQILDDSTDSTLEITLNWAKKLLALGFETEHIHRQKRDGYKAGALQNALKTAKGELIAIFDADFTINSNFLKETIPHFENQTGMVQTRWLFNNENQNFLTSLQAMALDSHFLIDQPGRNSAQYFINFNGTGGIWRKKCIESIGGWQDKSLTEDLDLSYRAQLSNWQFKYLPQFGNLSELPSTMAGIKSQQFRWAKGAAECAKLFLKQVTSNKNLTLLSKFNSTFHLLNSANYISLLIISLLSYPLFSYFKISNFTNILATVVQYSFMVYLLNTIVTAYKSNKNIFKSILYFPLFLAFISGISFHMSIGVLQGYWGKKSAFIRTPKFANYKANKTNYHLQKFNVFLVFEILLFLFFTTILVLQFKNKNYNGISFMAICCIGYGIIVQKTLIDIYAKIK